MRVLVVVPDVDVYGGTFRFLERLLCINARQGFVSALLVPTDLCTPELISLAESYGVEILRSLNRVLPATAPFMTPLYDILFSWRAVLTRRPDLIVVSTGDPGRLSILLYFPLPVLYILHSVPEKRFHRLPRWYLRVGSLLNNTVMTVSEAAARSISETMGILRSKIEVIYNSSSVAEFRKESDTPLVLTAGHLVEYKNPDVWLKVACLVLQNYPGSRFVWLGDGELLEVIRSKVNRMFLGDKILLPGYVSDPSKWYAQAHIYFQPSLRESHGIAVLEAMSHGLPCVVADAGGLPESVVNLSTGFVSQPDDATGFALRIMALLVDPGLRERMGSVGQQRVEKCFSEESQEQKIMALYKRLVNKSGYR